MPTMPLTAVFTTALQEPQWIVHSMLPRGQLVVLAGEPGVGKSILCYHLALTVALGREFLGFPTVATTVLYFDQENSLPDFFRYCQWIWRGLGSPPIASLEPHLRLEHLSLSANWQLNLERISKEFHPGLIIIDTASPAFHVEDENDNSEAGKIIEHLRRVQAVSANETPTPTLKHERQRDEVNPRRTIRGAKSWLGAVDAVVYHTRRAGRPDRFGLKDTFLEPDKSRAFGVRETVRIVPTWTDAERNGLILKGEIVIPPPAAKVI